MLTRYQQELLKDVGAPSDGYGQPIAAWKGSELFFKSDRATGVLTPLPADLARTFVDGVYILLKTRRSISVYRGYETKGLEAPFGKEHASFIQNLVSKRQPGKPDGMWWTPTRPAKSIDDLKLPSMHRAEDRAGGAIKLEWNRLDFYVEGELPAGSVIYVGRAAPQQESAAYGGGQYGGGVYQFRLTDSPERTIRALMHHRAI
jgi:hypothetical protein